MTTGLFDDVLPWLWGGLALLLALVERRGRNPLLLWAAAAALGTGILRWAAPGVPLLAQIALFAALTGALALVGAQADPAARAAARAERAERRRRAPLLVGRDVRVVKFHLHEGTVEADGMVWLARLDSATRPVAPGDPLRVVATDGRVLWVRPSHVEATDPVSAARAPDRRDG